MIYLKAVAVMALGYALVIGIVHIGHTYLTVGQQAGQIRQLKDGIADRDQTIRNFTEAATERLRQQEIADAESQSIRDRNAALAEEGDRLRNALADRLRVVSRACARPQPAAVPGAAVAVGAAPAPTGQPPAAPARDPEPVDATELAGACTRAAVAADVAESERNDLIRRYESVRSDFCQAHPERC